MTAWCQDQHHAATGTRAETYLECFVHSVHCRAGAMLCDDGNMAQRLLLQEEEEDEEEEDEDDEEEKNTKTAITIMDPEQTQQDPEMSVSHLSHISRLHRRCCRT